MQRAAMLWDKIMTLGCTGNKCCFLLSLESPSKMDKLITFRCTPLPRQVYIIMVVAHAERHHMEAKENALADHVPNQQP